MTTTAVLELVLRVTLLFATAAVVAAALRNRSASTRHLVWTVAVGASLLVPALSFVAPRWEVGILPAGLNVPAAPAATERIQAPAVDPGAHRNATLDRTRTAGAANSAALPAVTFDSAASNRQPALGERGAPRWSWSSIALATWAAGVLVVLLRLALGSARMWWLARRARKVDDGSWLRLAIRLARAFGVRRRVTFLEGAPSAMPMTWGVLKPRVLLPETVSSWPVDRQRVVLLHELAHVKRGDCLTQMLAQLACALYWFNPLVWLAASRLRAERERACDDLVLRAGTRGSDYADHLLEIARSLRGVAMPTWAAVAMAHRSQLEGRLMAILDPAVPRRSPSPAGAAGLALMGALIALPIVLLTPVPRAAEAVPPGDSIDSLAVPTDDERVETRTPVASRSSDASSAQLLTERDKREIADGVREAVREAVPAVKAVSLPLVEEVVDGVFDGIVQAVAELEPSQSAAQAPAGGVGGGVRGGVQGGVGQSRAQEDQNSEQKPDPRAVSALLDALKDEDQEVREQAIEALANLRVPEAIGAMRTSLKDGSPDVRERAAFALGQMRDVESVDALAAALKDESADVREQAAFALGQIRDRRAVPALGAAVKDENADVREQATFALGQLRDPSSVGAIRSALGDESPDVREQAAFALGQIRDPAAVEPLIGALKDENADVREQAVFALGQIGDPRAIDALTAALKDSNVEVRRQAAFALGQISR